MGRGPGVAGFSAIAAVALVASLAGCSGKSSESDDDDSGGAPGGSGTTGGSSGAAGAFGGTGGSARPAKLGIYMMLKNPDQNLPEAAGRSCPTATGVEYDIGRPIMSNGMVIDVDSPTPTDFGTTLADGEAGTEIRCTVTLDGVFQIDGAGTDPQITPPNGMLRFVFDGTASKTASPTTANLSVYTPRTFQLLSESGFPPCSITQVHEQAPGALWADYDCPALTEPTSPGIACHASGTFVVEYCATE